MLYFRKIEFENTIYLNYLANIPRHKCRRVQKKSIQKKKSHFFSQECIVVCVVSLEETNITPANVPYNQCKEVRTENSPTSNMDKITIAASAAICATIVVAVIIFIVANRRRARKLHTLRSIDQTKMGGPIAGLPVNCCSSVGPTPSPGVGPLSSTATLSAYNAQKEWDQVSAYSNRSIPRPRIFPIDRQGDRQMKSTNKIFNKITHMYTIPLHTGMCTFFSRFDN